MSIGSSWLYNGLQKEIQKCIVIDCRDYEEYDQGHLITAICMPPELGLNEDGEEDFVDLTELNEDYFRYRNHFAHYETRQGKHVVVYNNNDHNMWIGHVISCVDVEGLAINVQTLEDGYDEFRSRFPFLCTTSPDPHDLFSVPGYPFPTEVTPRFLYLSSSLDKLVPEHLENLGITDVLYTGERPDVPLNFNVTLTSIGDNTLSNEQFIKFTEIITKLKKDNKTVLLLTDKTDTLLSLGAFYLISFDKVTLRQACNFVIQSFWKDERISTANLKLLHQQEKQLLGSNSLQDHEITSGEIPEYLPSKMCIIS